MVVGIPNASEDLVFAIADGRVLDLIEALFHQVYQGLSFCMRQESAAVGSMWDGARSQWQLLLHHVRIDIAESWIRKVVGVDLVSKIVGIVRYTYSGLRSHGYEAAIGVARLVEQPRCEVISDNCWGLLRSQIIES